MKNYAKQIGCADDVMTWIDNVLSKQENISVSEYEHILDYMSSEDRPKRISRMSFEQAKKNTEKWLKKLNKKGEHIKELKKDTKVILDFKDGFKFVQLVGKNAYEREGYLMRHCCSSYYGKDDEIYSLRDKNNMPHCTISKQSQQIKGKGNGEIHPNYIKYVVEFLEYLKIEVRDSEMLNLGYVNIEKIEDDNAIFPKEYLFKDKYFYKKEIDKIVDKNGEKYENITLWDTFNLFDFDFKLKFHFNIKNSINTFIKLSKKIFKKDSSKNASSGDSSQNSSSGNSSKNASSGDYSQNASSGDYSQNASSGDSSQNSSSGDYSQNASSGYSSKNASSGDHSKNASSGNSSQNASSGDYSQNASSGDYSKNASSGYYSTIEMLGKYNVGAAIGRNSRIKGIKGNWICLAEYNNKNICVNMKSAQIDGKILKENTFYKLVDGEFVESN